MSVSSLQNTVPAKLGSCSLPTGKNRAVSPWPVLSQHKIEYETTAGFTLLEMVCTLAIVALLAAVLLPRLPTATSRARLEAYAVEVATLLKADRNVALARRASVEALVDVRERLVRSGASARMIKLPDDVAFDALLPQRCNGRQVLSTITFLASGMSCGGVIRLTRPGNGYEVRVNWLTAGVEIVAQDGVRTER